MASKNRSKIKAMPPAPTGHTGAPAILLRKLGEALSQLFQTENEITDLVAAGQQLRCEIGQICQQLPEDVVRQVGTGDLSSVDIEFLVPYAKGKTLRARVRFPDYDVSSPVDEAVVDFQDVVSL